MIRHEAQHLPDGCKKSSRQSELVYNYIGHDSKVAFTYAPEGCDRTSEHHLQAFLFISVCIYILLQ